MNIQNGVILAPFTSFGVGGPAEHFALVENTEDLIDALKCTTASTPLWIIGYGSNSLISDKGLSGMTICVRNTEVKIEGNLVIADAGAWWDDVVKKAISNNLWGIELMSEIPGSVGGSAYINITAYGQSLGKAVEWIEVWDRNNSETKTIYAESLRWGYKDSIFQSDSGKNFVILRVCLKLSNSMTDELTYQKALDVAEELNISTTTLENRRSIIIETRRRAGSLWHPNSQEPHTVGSFFRNPQLSSETAKKVIAFDESGKTEEQIKKMNKTHGGSEQRVSGAHVMLAAGFKRGQKWNNVKLNDQNVLKIEALSGSTAQEIFNVYKEIQRQCLDKLGVNLEPEARILGDFN
jgi:UDP-N-acetylmuramate dehydrogenase